VATEYSPIGFATSSSDTTHCQSTNRSHKRRDVVSSSRLDQLTDKPLVKFKLQELHPRPRKLYEGDAMFLDEASDESFGASEMVSGCSNVQEWSIDVFATGSLADDRNFSGGSRPIHVTPHGHGKPIGLVKTNRLVAGHLMPPLLVRVTTVALTGNFSSPSSNNRRRFPLPQGQDPWLIRGEDDRVPRLVLPTHRRNARHVFLCRGCNDDNHLKPVGRWGRRGRH
jgi:hypothetical protein